MENTGKTVSVFLKSNELRLLKEIKAVGEAGTTDVLRRGIAEFAKELNIPLVKNSSENSWQLYYAYVLLYK